MDDPCSVNCTLEWTVKHNLYQHLFCRRCRSCRLGSPSPRRRSTGGAWRRSSSRSDPGSAWTAASTGGSWTGMSGLWPMSFKGTVARVFQLIFLLNLKVASSHSSYKFPASNKLQNIADSDAPLLLESRHLRVTVESTCRCYSWVYASLLPLRQRTSVTEYTFCNPVRLWWFNVWLLDCDDLMFVMFTGC
jgi:hypothetical protein